MKKIFFVIVTYNGMKWIEKCIDSISNVDIPIKIIVVDNTSSDGTVKVIESRYPSVEIIQPGKNLGFGKGNNVGIKSALTQGADYVFLLNQDAYLLKGSLKNLIESFDRFPDAGIISPLHLAGDGNCDFGFYKYVDPKDTPNLLGDMFRGEVKEAYETGFVNAAAWIIKADVLRRVGFFHPIFDHYSEDREYVDRLYKLKYKFYIYPALMIVHDRPQSRVENSFFAMGETFKRTILLNLITGKMSRPQAHATYLKAFLDKVLRFRFKHAFITLKNWGWLRNKMDQMDSMSQEQVK